MAHHDETKSPTSHQQNYTAVDNGKSAAYKPNVCTFFNSLIGPVVGGFIAGCIGLYLGRRRWERDGRDKFHTVVAIVESELDGSEEIDDLAQKVHAGSLEKIKTAVYAVSPFISKRNVSKLRELWFDYRDIKPQDVGAINYIVRKVSWEAGEKKEPAPKFPHELIKDRLRKMQEVVK